MKILIVDDDPIHNRQLEVTLGRWGYDVCTAENGVAALGVLAEQKPIQLVIADWMMPEMDGITLCRKIRSDFNDPYVYLILLTSRDQRDDVIAGLDSGADDYLTKPIHHTELMARVRAAKRIIDLQNSLLETQEQLRIEATHDALTGILNRRAILGSLDREIRRGHRQDASITVALIDIDHFKRVNDTHGHLVGDDALRETARRIASAVRPYDYVGRYGGEEFLVVAPGTEAAGAIELAERIRHLFESDPIPTSGPALPVTLSLGVVTFRGGADINQVLGTADDALYEAKRSGRNTSRLRSL